MPSRERERVERGRDAPSFSSLFPMALQAVALRVLGISSTTAKFSSNALESDWGPAGGGCSPSSSCNNVQHTHVAKMQSVKGGLLLLLSTYNPNCIAASTSEREHQRPPPQPRQPPGGRRMWVMVVHTLLDRQCPFGR